MDKMSASKVSPYRFFTYFVVGLCFFVSIQCGCSNMSHGTPDSKVHSSIGVAMMREDGTIVLQLRAEDPSRGIIGDTILEYPPQHPQYNAILKHLGGLKKGQTKDVPPWSEE